MGKEPGNEEKLWIPDRPCTAHLAKGKREYSSTTVSMYAFRDVVGSGPLKSILSRSIGCVDFVSVPGVGRYNCGFSSAQILHVEQVFLTSSVENGMFFDLTKCNIRVTPG